MKKVIAPWTVEQVFHLKEFQDCEFIHPFTGKRKENGDATVLIPTPDGWIEYPDGPVVQDWAWDAMMDGSLAKVTERFKIHKEYKESVGFQQVTVVREKS